MVKYLNIFAVVFFLIKEIKMSIFPSMEVELCNMSSPLH